MAAPEGAGPSPGAASGGLARNAVGLLGATTLGIVMLSPAMSLYGSFGPAYLAAGRSAALAFVWALAATLPTATSYALLSQEIPCSGSAASWISSASRGLGASGAWLGRWAGWIVLLYYLNCFAIQPVVLGLFFNDLLAILGARPGFLTFLAGAAAACAWPARIVFRGVRGSTRGALAFLLFETAVLVALCVTVALVSHRSGARFSADGFTLAAAPSGMQGMSGALVFGLLAFCGYDVISTLSEEARMASRLVPKATFLALLFFGALMIGGIWILGYALSAERLREVADAGGMPITEIARACWGKGAILVPITAISAALGVGIAASVGASRVLFAMARGGLAPGRFAVLSARSRVPVAALALVFGVGFVASVGVAAWLGAFNAYVWWGTTTALLALLTYLMVNVSALILFRRRIRRSLAGCLLHGVVPLFGIAVDAIVLTKSFVIDLWQQGQPLRSVLFFGAGCAVLAGVLARKKFDASAPRPAT